MWDADHNNQPHHNTPFWANTDSTQQYPEVEEHAYSHDRPFTSALSFDIESLFQENEIKNEKVAPREQEIPSNSLQVFYSSQCRS